MHIFHDGILVNKLKYFLKYFINEGSIFTLQNLNKEIETFSYGYSHMEDKPCNIKATDLDQQAHGTLAKEEPKCVCRLKFSLLFKVNLLQLTANITVLLKS